MTGPAPAVVDRATAAVAQGDVEAFVACCAEDVMIEPLLGGVEGAYRGHDGARSWLGDRASAWGEIRFELGPFRPAPTPGFWLTEGMLHATSRESEIPLDQPVAGALRVDGAGRIAWLGFFRSSEEASDRLQSL